MSETKTESQKPPKICDSAEAAARAYTYADQSSMSDVLTVEDLDDMVTLTEKWPQGAKNVNTALREENRRLREALERIIQVGDCQRSDWYGDIASEALKGEGDAG